jgi:pimeloyl-ACP methyl ester carboxylesterase
MRSKLFLAFSIVLSLILLMACRSSPKNTPTPVFTATPVPTSTPPPTPTPTPYAITNPQLIDVGEGYYLLINCVGEGSPTIIFENGFGTNSFDESIANQVSAFSRNCRYLRRGMIGEPVGSTRTTEDQVQDLHILLTKAGIPGPYVLVGHSIAGFNMPLYYSHYPEEVVGMVCVDCRPPFFTRNLMEALGEAKTDEPTPIRDLRATLTLGAPEYMDFTTSEAQAQKITSLGDIPFIVLVAGATFADDPAYIPYGLDKVWQASGEGLSQLSSRGRVEIIPNASHMSITTSDEVIQAIREVVEAVRQKP